MNHSFQNVRDRLGSILINIFEADLCFKGAAEPECPRIKEFVSEIISRIQIMHKDLPKGEPMEIDSASGLSTVSPVAHTEYDEAVRLYKTGTLIDFHLIVLTFDKW